MHKFVIVAAGVVAGAVLAVPQANSARVITESRRAIPDLEAVEKIVKLVPTDVGRRGLSVGDRLAFRAVLRDPKGARLGIGGGECLLVKGNTEATALYTCITTYRLTGGQIATQGYLDFSKTAGAVAIVGGTGKYAGASGELAFTATSATTVRETFRFFD